MPGIPRRWLAAEQAIDGGADVGLPQQAFAGEHRVDTGANPLSPALPTPYRLFTNFDLEIDSEPCSECHLERSRRSGVALSAGGLMQLPDDSAPQAQHVLPKKAPAHVRHQDCLNLENMKTLKPGVCRALRGSDDRIIFATVSGAILMATRLFAGAGVGAEKCVPSLQIFAGRRFGANGSAHFRHRVASTRVG